MIVFAVIGVINVAATAAVVLGHIAGAVSGREGVGALASVAAFGLTLWFGLSVVL